MKYLTKILLLIVSPLVIGMGIYLIEKSFQLPVFICNYVPDALWSFSLTYLLFTTGITRKRIFATLCIVLMAAATLEVQQPYFGGTYDPRDLLAYVIGATMVFFIPLRKPNPYEK